MKRWANYGFIFFGVSLVVLLIIGFSGNAFYSCSGDICTSTFFGEILLFIELVLAWPVIVISNLGEGALFFIILGFVANLVYLFLIGAIIGLVVEKVKGSDKK